MMTESLTVDWGDGWMAPSVVTMVADELREAGMLLSYTVASNFHSLRTGLSPQEISQ